MSCERWIESSCGEAHADMDAGRAQALAERLHHGQLHRDGTLLIDHVRRVAAAVPGNARVVAWLHETLEHTPISEQALLAEGLSLDELRAIRLLTRDLDMRSDAIYLAHVERVARARGPGSGVARIVKLADMADRALHAPESADGWSPPYEAGIELLNGLAVRRRRLDPSREAPDARAHTARFAVAAPSLPAPRRSTSPSVHPASTSGPPMKRRRHDIGSDGA
jgi:hypothetical protein